MSDKVNLSKCTNPTDKPETGFEWTAHDVFCPYHSVVHQRQVERLVEDLFAPTLMLNTWTPRYEDMPPIVVIFA